MTNKDFWLNLIFGSTLFIVLLVFNEHKFGFYFFGFYSSLFMIQTRLLTYRDELRDKIKEMEQK